MTVQSPSPRGEKKIDGGSATGDSLFIQGVIVESAGCSRALGLVLSYYLLTDPLKKWMFTTRYPEERFAPKLKKKHLLSSAAGL